MPFTTVCLSCGQVFRLLDRYRKCKVMCPDCRKPFIAENAKDDTLEVTELPADLPLRGWLVVCPSCGQTEMLADEQDRRTHCPQCGTALPKPHTESKTLRKKETPES